MSSIVPDRTRAAGGDGSRARDQPLDLVRPATKSPQAAPDRVAVGVRVYPGTELGERARRGELTEGLVGGNGAQEPLFFLEPAVASSVFELLDHLVGDDERFLFFDPTRPARNYNYNANERLTEAIREGYRGAYSDMLRRYA